MTKDTALRLALEALISCRNLLEIEANKAIARDASDVWIREKEAELRQHDNAITAIKAALEAQTRSVVKDEPVALKPCGYESKETKMCRKCGQVHAEAIWDTTPPQRKPLTDETRNWIVATCPTPRHIIDAVERMHGIKEKA